MDASALWIPAIPAPYFDQVRGQFRLYYGRVSHGSQISTGLHMLEDLDPVLCEDITSYEPSDDLGTLGDVSWVPPTRSYLDAHPECNLDQRNDQMRAYCEANGKVLFDFADIESYDPDGVW